MKDSDNVFAGGSCIRVSTCECLDVRVYILELLTPFRPPCWLLPRARQALALSYIPSFCVFKMEFPYRLKLAS